MPNIATMILPATKMLTLPAALALFVSPAAAQSSQSSYYQSTLDGATDEGTIQYQRPNPNSEINENLPKRPRLRVLRPSFPNPDMEELSALEEDKIQKAALAQYGGTAHIVFESGWSLAIDRSRRLCGMTKISGKSGLSYNVDASSGHARWFLYRTDAKPIGDYQAPLLMTGEGLARLDVMLPQAETGQHMAPDGPSYHFSGNAGEAIHDHVTRGNITILDYRREDDGTLGTSKAWSMRRLFDRENPMADYDKDEGYYIETEGAGLAMEAVTLCAKTMRGPDVV